MTMTGTSCTRSRIERCTLFVSLALLWFLLACGAKPKADAPKGYAAGRSAFAAGSRALSMLPADTLAAAVAKSPAALAQKLRWPDIMREYGPIYEKMQAELVSELGVDLMDVQKLTAIGVDPGGAFGIAVLTAADENAVFFATVSDADKLRSFFYQISAKVGEKVNARSVGNAMILTPHNEDDVGMVIRGNQGFFVLSDKERDRDAIVNAIATIAPEASLEATKEFQETAAKLDFGGDMAGYLAMHEVGRLLESELRSDSYGTYLQGEIAGLEREIAQAQERGEDTTALKERLVSVRKDLERAELRDRARLDFVREVFAGLGGIAMGAELGGAAIRVKTVIRPEPGSIPAAVLRPAKKPLALWRAGDRPPLFAIAGHADPGALLRLIELMLELDGAGMDRTDAEMMETFGVSLSGDVRPLVSGELALAFYGPEVKSLADWSEKNFGLQLLVGVSDGAKTQALLDKVASHGELAKLVKRRPNGGLEVPFPLSGTLYIDVAGNYLVAATDPEVKSRIVAKGDGFVAELPADQKALVRDSVSATMMLNPGALAWFFFSRSGYRYRGEEFPDDPQATQEYRQAVAELRKVDEELEAVNKKLEEAQMRSVGVAAQAIGRMMLTAEVRGDEIHIYGGQYSGAKDLGAAVQAMLELVEPELARARAGGTGEEDVATLQKRVNELYERRWLLVDRLNQMRQQQAAPVPN